MGRNACYCRFVRNHFWVDRGGARGREGVDRWIGWSGVADRFLCGGVWIECSDVAAGSVSVTNVQWGQSDDAVSVWGAELSVVLSAAGSDPGATLFGYRSWRRVASDDPVGLSVVALVGWFGGKVWREIAADRRAADCRCRIRSADAERFRRILLVEGVSGCDGA